MFFYAILGQVILSWFPHTYTPVYNLLTFVSAPIMQPLRRHISPVGGYDITPIPALIGLQFIIILAIEPLFMFGMQIAYN